MSYFKTFPNDKRRGLIFDSNHHFSGSKSTSTDFCSHFQFSEKFSGFVVVCLQNRFSVNLKNACGVLYSNARPYFSVCFFVFKIKFVKKWRILKWGSVLFSKSGEKKSWKHSTMVQCKFIWRNILFCISLEFVQMDFTVWKNEKFGLTEKLFRQINS